MFKAKNRETQEIVALKRVRLDDDDEVFKLYFIIFLLITITIIMVHLIPLLRLVFVSYHL